MKRFPIIDYTIHPAFKDLPQYSDSISTSLLISFQELNNRMNEFDSQKQALSVQLIEEYYKNSIAPFVASSIVNLIETSYQGNANSKNIMLNAFDGFVNKLIDQSIYFNIKKQYPIKLTSANAKKVYEELSENGITLSSISKENIENYKKGISAYINELKKQSDISPFGRKALGLPKRSSHWRIIEKNMKNSGFLEGASAFYGSDLTVTGCGLEYSSDRQRWWQNCYEDVGIVTNKCVYMHNDYDYDYVKSLVYLNDVESMEGGPFCYIPESHKWTREKSLSFYIKETERLLYQTSKEFGKKNYYRSAMSCPHGRELFIALPALFRQLSHFGDDVMDNSELSNELLSKEMAVTSDKGNFCFFTGGSGIHRGGTVFKGERWALQITLTKEPNLKKKITSVARKTTGSVMASILGEQKMIELSKKIKSAL